MTTTTDTSALTALVSKLAAYVHASADIPSWDQDEIASQLDDILVATRDLQHPDDTYATDDQVRALAAKQWPDELIDITSNAAISYGDDNGAYVQAWVWVDFAGTDLDNEDEEDDS